MAFDVPGSSRQLRKMLARRMGATAIVIGLAAGGVSYLIQTRRAEQAAFEHATDGVRHFESSAMHVAKDGSAADEHGALTQLLDRSRFVGIRVFGPDQSLIYETWEDVPPGAMQAVRSSAHRRDWPTRGENHRAWIEVDDERLIKVVLPLFEKEGRLAGYLEGVSRLDRQELDAQREQIRAAALLSVGSVLVTALILYPLLLAMLRRSFRLSSDLLDSQLALMHSLGNAVAKRDADTDAHNYRVTYYAVALAETMGVAKQDITDLIAGAFLHDVGKIGIADHILLKPGKLTPEEFAIMKTHPLLGVDIVRDNPWLIGAARTIRHHHERFDGSGYPDGLCGEAIPLNARVFAVADVFDALTSQRPYKQAMTFAGSLRIIEEDSGRHFDPAVVTAFKGIALRLYEETTQSSDIELKRRMRDALHRYYELELRH